LKKFTGPFFLFMAFALAGTSVVSARLVSSSLGPFQITAGSLLFALALLLPLSAKKLIPELKAMSGRRALSLALQALTGIFLFRLFLLCGLPLTSAGEAGILTGATPAMTALLAAIFLREAPDLKKLLGILGTIAGILLIQGLGTGGGLSARHIIGNLLVLCAAASEAVFNILSRVFAVSEENPGRALTPVVQTTAVTALAFLFSLVPALAELGQHPLTSVGPPGWLALGWYGLVVTALGFIFWYAGIKRSGAFTAAAFSGMMPLTSLVVSALFLGERPDTIQWTGGVFVILGMLLIGSGAAFPGKKRQVKAEMKGRTQADA
jgi:drug/metabolite transporter (DMT)-like permease